GRLVRGATAALRGRLLRPAAPGHALLAPAGLVPGARNGLLYAASERGGGVLCPTGFFAPDPFLFVQKGRQRLLVMSDLERDRARGQARVDRVLSRTPVPRRAEASGARPTAPAVIARVLRDLQLRRVEVPRSFPLGLAMELDAQG